MAALSLRGAGLLKMPIGSTSALANVVSSCNYASEVCHKKQWKFNKMSYKMLKENIVLSIVIQFDSTVGTIRFVPVK